MCREQVEGYSTRSYRFPNIHQLHGPAGHLVTTSYNLLAKQSNLTDHLLFYPWRNSVRQNFLKPLPCQGFFFFPSPWPSWILPHRLKSSSVLWDPEMSANPTVPPSKSGGWDHSSILPTPQPPVWGEALCRATCRAPTLWRRGRLPVGSEPRTSSSSKPLGSFRTRTRWTLKPGVRDRDNGPLSFRSTSSLLSSGVGHTTHSILWRSHSPSLLHFDGIFRPTFRLSVLFVPFRRPFHLPAYPSKVSPPTHSYFFFPMRRLVGSQLALTPLVLFTWPPPVRLNVLFSFRPRSSISDRFVGTSELDARVCILSKHIGAPCAF